MKATYQAVGPCVVGRAHCYPAIPSLFSLESRNSSYRVLPRGGRGGVLVKERLCNDLGRLLPLPRQRVSQRQVLREGVTCMSTCNGALVYCTRCLHTQRDRHIYACVCILIYIYVYKHICVCYFSKMFYNLEKHCGLTSVRRYFVLVPLLACRGKKAEYTEFY